MGSHDLLEAMETTLETPWSCWCDPLELLVRPLGCTPSVRRKVLGWRLKTKALARLSETIHSKTSKFLLFSPPPTLSSKLNPPQTLNSISSLAAAIKVSLCCRCRRHCGGGATSFALCICSLIIMERFFKRKSSSGSSSSNNVDSSNTVGSSRTPSSRQSQLDGVLGNLEADPGLRTRIIDYNANMRDEYSVSKDAAFCLYCYLFKTNFAQVGSEAFTGDGFKTWKKGKERFKMHVGPVGSVHNKVREAATNLMNQATHIETAVSKHSDQAHKAYRTCLNASIKCTNATSSNRGNYLKLLQFLADNNDKVREVVMENAPGYLRLVAPSIQKEIVNSCALETLDAIMDGLKDRFFSIFVDEARDVSVKEQMAMVLRYVDDNGHVIERFVGIQHVTNTTSSSLNDAIDTLFSHNGLSISKLRGQGYDSASNMRGELNDLKTKILREQPCAYYVHCFAHQLQLALVAVAKKNIDIASFFATANSVVNHVGASCKRRDLLREQLQEELVIAFENDCLITGRCLNQETSLKRAGDTRWNSHYGTLISIISMFSFVVHVLQMVIDDNPNENAGGANKLMRDICTFEFVFHIFLMKVILGLTNDLSQALQRKDQEIVNAMALVKSCKEKLHWMRNNGFDALLLRLAQFYPQNFSDEDRLTLEDQLEIYIHYVRSSSDFSQLERIGDLANKMVETMMHQVFNYVYLLITLSLVLPVATASVERAFSVMNIVKGPLRNKMGDQWLSDSLLVYIERDIFACIENEAIMLRFQNMKPRRGQL
ncbi:unnamed protein product [Malus baccata var. baccata]